MIVRYLTPGLLVLLLSCAPSGHEKSVPSQATTAAPATRAPTSSPPAPPPVPERSSSGAPEEPLRVGGEVLRPQIIKRVEPDLSRLQDRKIRSVLLYEATITAQGDVANVRVIRSSHPDIDAAVMAALRQWKFRPATRKGKPVAVYYTLMVNFHPS